MTKMEKQQYLTVLNMRPMLSLMQGQIVFKFIVMLTNFKQGENTMTKYIIKDANGDQVGDPYEFMSSALIEAEGLHIRDYKIEPIADSEEE